MLTIFTSQEDENNLEQLLLAIMRLTGLDYLPRTLVPKNIKILQLLLDFYRENLRHVGLDCIQ